MRVSVEMIKKALKEGYMLSFVRCGDVLEQIIVSNLGVSFYRLGQETIKKDDVVFNDNIQVLECKAISFPMDKTIRLEF